MLDPLWSLLFFPVIFTTYYKDRRYRWPRWVFSTQFAIMFKCHEHLSFKFKFQYNSETGLSLLNFSFFHSSKAVHKYLPLNSPQSHSQIVCSVLTRLERWCSLGNVFRRSLKTGKWVDGRDTLWASCWGKAECSPWQARQQVPCKSSLSGPRAIGNEASLVLLLGEVLVQTYCWQQRKDNS